MNKEETDLHKEKPLIIAVNNIFKKWDCTLEEKLAILGISETVYQQISDSKKEVYLNDDVLERISYVLNIYESLGVIFNNPLNRHGFLRSKNKSERFKGLSPMEHTLKYGTAESLKDVFGYLDENRFY